MKSLTPLLALCGGLCAQSFDELTTVRNRVLPNASVFEVRGGVIGSHAKDKNPDAGLDDKLGWDGAVLYSQAASGRGNDLTAYAGRDGLYASLRDGNAVGNETSARLELKARLFPFWREGYYQGRHFLPTGMYEGRDYEGYLGFGRLVQEALFVEFGPYYRKNTFSRNDQTDTLTPGFVLPDNHASYGARIFLEQNTIHLDNLRGMPDRGFVFTAVIEREWNDSSQEFGYTGFSSELPSAVWRGRGRLEWYLPQGDSATWEILGLGAWLDKTDRIVEYEAQHPQGDLWVDGQLRLRFDLGDAFTLTPFAQGQYVQIRDQAGGKDKKFFLGGGVEAWLHLSQSFSVNAWYSYLDNESRPSVSTSEDIHGQHMFYAGMVLRIGSGRR